MKKLNWGETEKKPKDEDHKEEEKEIAHVESVDNRIYFYAPIRSHEILRLNKHLKEVSNALLHSAYIQNRKPASIYLHIN